MDRIFYTFLAMIFGLSLSCTPVYAISYPTPVDFTHKVLKWTLDPSDSAVDYRVVSEYQDDYDRFINTINEAANLWGGIAGSQLDLNWSQNDQSAHITLHLQSSINDSSFSAGYAEFDEINDEGEPVHCSIYVLVAPNFSFNSIAKTILHEFGHCLGLGHSLIPEAIMSYHLDKNGFRLDLDDIAAIVRLYPQVGEAQLAPGCGVGLTNHKSKCYLVFFMMVAPLILLFLRGMITPLP